MSALIHIAAPLLELPARPAWLDSLGRWMDMGVLEQPGPDHDHPLIVELLQLAGVRGPLHDEIPWCGSGMNGAMLEAGLCGPERPFHARSWESWGRRLERPQFGCVAVLWRQSMASGLGHVTAWLDEAPGDRFYALGCNQRNRVCITLEPRTQLLSCRWPDESCLMRAA